MNPLCWSSCVWLWFMCAYVECLPKFHVSSRDQYDESVSVTLNYIFDESLDTEVPEYLNAWLSWVTQKAMSDFQLFFGFTLNISYTITYLASQGDLQSKLEPYEEPSLQPEGAISALAEYFKDKSHSDIICLVTKEKIDDGYYVRNGYGNYEHHTLCKNGLPILLAYARGQEGYSSHMLLNILLNSIHLRGANMCITFHRISIQK
uniref:Putative p32 protein n=1 Tax=Ixodes ricinus TaxID=34613 RepID=A0A0K8RH32_IXORI